MPPPTRIWLTNCGYIVQYDLNGYFATYTALKFLSDIISRFCITFGAEYLDFTPQSEPDTDNGLSIELKDLAKDLEKLKKRFNGQQHASKFEDERFWSMKLWVEKKLKEGETVTQQELFLWARTNLDGSLSTLKAKSKSIYNYYQGRGFQPSEGRTHEMSRTENAKKQAAAKAQKAKAAVLSVYTSMQFLDEKTTITAVGKNAGVDRKTASKYLKELKEEGLIKD